MFCWDVLGMLLGYEWGKVAVMVWARGGSNFRGWRGLMLWSSQLHDKGAIGSAYTLLH